MFMTACNNTNPFMTEWNTPYGIPPFEKIENKHYLPAITEGIAQQQAEIDAIIACTETPCFENVIEPLERSGALLARVEGVLFNLSESMNSPELQDIVSEALPLLSEHGDNITMNADLFAKVKAVYEQSQEGLSVEQKKVLKDTYESFLNNGIGLDEASQARLREINTALSSLQQTFGNNLLSENNLYLEKFGSSISEYSSVMAVTADRELRREMFLAYSNRCNNGGEFDNNAVVLEILRLKQEKARILGYDCPAAWILHDKMAGNPATVDIFLGGIMAPAVAKAKQEIADMQEIMDADIAAGLLPAGSKIEPWDWFYYATKVQEIKYALNEDELKPYFPMEQVREGVFASAKTLYGIDVKPIADAPKYHPEMEAFEVTNEDGSLVGVFLSDYFPRQSKRGGAWMENVRGQQIVGGEDIRPIIVNVGNFSRPVDGKPGLLSVDDVETMFHEFGHALHGLLSECVYPSVSGTSVARDFVELPSQINENFAFQPELLAQYARHYETGEVIPQALVDKILATRTFNQGFKTTELCAASILDMCWHELGKIPADADAAWIKAKEQEFCQKMGLIDEIIPRYRTTYFNHIFNSGYSAGYYSYLWAEVLDKDAFQVFARGGVFNREIGMKFRDCVLSKGGSDEPMTLYKNFTGAEPNPEYLLKARGLK